MADRDYFRDLVTLYVTFERREAKAKDDARRLRRERHQAAASRMEGIAAAYGAARVRVQLTLDLDPASIRTEYHLMEREAADG